MKLVMTWLCEACQTTFMWDKVLVNSSAPVGILLVLGLRLVLKVDEQAEMDFNDFLGCWDWDGTWGFLCDSVQSLFQVGFRKGGVDILGRRTQLEVLLSVLLLAALLALLACLLVLGLGFSSGSYTQHTCLPISLPLLPSSLLPLFLLYLLSFSTSFSLLPSSLLLHLLFFYFYLLIPFPFSFPSLFNLVHLSASFSASSFPIYFFVPALPFLSFPYPPFSTTSCPSQPIPSFLCSQFLFFYFLSFPTHTHPPIISYVLPLFVSSSLFSLLSSLSTSTFPSSSPPVYVFSVYCKTCFLWFSPTFFPMMLCRQWT